MKRIVVSKDTVRLLAQVFEVTNMTVYRALNYSVNNERATRIRKLALDKGGYVLGGEELETIFPTTGIMVQTYGDRLRIVMDMEADTVIVFLNGEEVSRHKGGMTVPEYMRLQQLYIRKVDATTRE